ncbi:MAG: ribosome biogenesis GTP-binding protein YihA/YsxC [Candidatus Methylomirabilis sp.]|nr:ribosome biogenesis GTP-binding protein YihA/YsxC [Deltaproteobacteria bacterium]
MRVRSAAFVASAPDLASCPGGELPEIAFAGRSNVGKSSLLNALLGRKRLAHVSKTPGRTQTINFFLVNDAFHVVDLPGYGYAKVSKGVRVEWGRAIERYLRDRPQLRGVVQLVDARHDPTALDVELFEWLEAIRTPHVVVATKADKLSGNALAKQAAAIRRTLRLGKEDLVAFSAATGRGKEDLWRVVLAMLEAPPRAVL